MVKETNKIDLHHHILPAEFVSKLKEKGIESGLGVRLPKCSVDKSLSFMKKHGIESAITSIGIPGGINDYEFLGKLSRWCDEYSAKLKHDYPDKFGAFTNIPLPDIKTSLKERSN